jgi:hypothetical protein
VTDFAIELTDERRAVLRFETFPAFAHDRLLAALQNIEARLEAAVIADEPQQKGKLRSLTGGRVYDHGNRIAAVVGVRATDQNEARKAAALEYGSHQALMVRAHAAKLAHLWGRAISPMMVQVSAHSRTPNIEAHRFLREPIGRMRAEFLAELRAAVEAAAQEANRQ